MGDGILHVGPFVGKLSGREGTGRWADTGPLRWVYRWETEFHGHRVRQDVILDAGCRHFDLLTRVFCAGANGQFMLCFDMPIDGEMNVDIPFGVEKRDLSEEPYAAGKVVTTDSIERHRENQMWARSWASLSDGEVGVSVISVDGDKYWTWDAVSRELRHILFTPLDDNCTDWEAWVTKERVALGWHTFHHRVVLHDGDWQTAGMPLAGDLARVPLQAVKPLGEGEVELEDGEAVARRCAAILAVEPTTVRLSALYEEGGELVLRVYESAGEQTDGAGVVLPRDYGSVDRTDFNGEYVSRFCNLDGKYLVFDLRPWEIATFVLS